MDIETQNWQKTHSGPIRAITRRYAITCQSSPFEGVYDAVIDLASGQMVVSRVEHGTLTGPAIACRTFADVLALFGGKSILISAGSYQDERGDSIPDLVAFALPDAVERVGTEALALTRLHGYMRCLLQAGMSTEQALNLGYDFAYSEAGAETDYHTLPSAERAAEKLLHVAKELGISAEQQRRLVECSSTYGLV